MHKFKKVIFSSIAILSLSAAVTPITSVFAEGDEARPQTELTAGKEGDKDKTVSKNDQALTDNGKNEKQSDKETTVLNKEEKKPEPKKIITGIRFRLPMWWMHCLRSLVIIKQNPLHWLHNQKQKLLVLWLLV